MVRGTADLSASLGMTKGRLALPLGVMVVMEAKPDPDGCPTFARAYVGRKRWGEAPSTASLCAQNTLAGRAVEDGQLSWEIVGFKTTLSSRPAVPRPGMEIRFISRAAEGFAVQRNIRAHPHLPTAICGVCSPIFPE